MNLAVCDAVLMQPNPLPRPDEPKTDQPLYVVVVKTSIRSSIPRPRFPIDKSQIMFFESLKF
jgi:hypothetical protein